MLAVVQRVSRASVRVAPDYEASIDWGLLILVGVGREDDDRDADWLAEKCASLRIFNDSDGKMNRGLDAVGGAALVISQFTLWGDCEKGRRPSFIRAAEPADGERLYERFADRLAETGVPVRRGIFGAMMQVELVNDGPVTLIVDSGPWKRRRFGGTERS
ncbi:MAG: D-tyrosyl-tRNA(Tyr) deacylase [Candidatus Eisenbacteria bacterium]|nr:D-tyrosyl-tRNA(Tyr) deacylase [Candidatus Latescibacterota bacterium]MBD3301720.1 D-tyrosyl-tRNA(Tyr) deacylase [Candidatus Eisenbacteria bacterium]